jgi:hypothetical protein
LGLGLSFFANNINKSKSSFNLLILFALPVLMIVTFDVSKDLGKSKKQDWETLAKFNPKAMVFSPSWVNLNYCYHLDKGKYFDSKKENFLQKCHQEFIFEDYYFLENWQKINWENKSIFIYQESKFVDTEMQKILTLRFILIKQHTDNIWEYKLKRQ